MINYLEIKPVKSLVLVEIFIFSLITVIISGIYWFTKTDYFLPFIILSLYYMTFRIISVWFGKRFLWEKDDHSLTAFTLILMDFVVSFIMVVIPLISYLIFITAIPFSLIEFDISVISYFLYYEILLYYFIVKKIKFYHNQSTNYLSGVPIVLVFIGFILIIFNYFINVHFNIWLNSHFEYSFVPITLFLICIYYLYVILIKYVDNISSIFEDQFLIGKQNFFSYFGKILYFFLILIYVLSMLLGIFLYREFASFLAGIFLIFSAGMIFIYQFKIGELFLENIRNLRLSGDTVTIEVQRNEIIFNKDFLIRDFKNSVNFVIKRYPIISFPNLLLSAIFFAGGISLTSKIIPWDIIGTAVCYFFILEIIIFIELIRIQVKLNSKSSYFRQKPYFTSIGTISLVITLIGSILNLFNIIKLF